MNDRITKEFYDLCQDSEQGAMERVLENKKNANFEHWPTDM